VSLSEHSWGHLAICDPVDRVHLQAGLRTSPAGLRILPASLRILWAVAFMAHSPLTFSMPRRRNWRNPLASLICPNTGSTTCLRSR
jgi:hypothetical protein